MPVERGTVKVTGLLDLEPEPGFYISKSGSRAELHFSGALGVRVLSKIIEQAEALKKELAAAL